MFTYEIISLLFFCLFVLIYAQYQHLKKNKLHWVEENGWVSPDIKSLLAEKEMMEFIQSTKERDYLWFESIDQDRYVPWDMPTDESMLKRLWDFSYFKNNDEIHWNIERSRLSAAAFILGLRIPSRLWLYNRDTLLQIARHEIIRGPRWLVPETEPLAEYVESDQLSIIIDILRCDDLFLSMLLLPTAKLYPFADLWDAYRTHMQFELSLNNDRRVFKKALTIVFHITDTAIPRDYFYFDKEVRDFLLK